MVRRIPRDNVPDPAGRMAPIELYPFRGETSERMMMAFLPGPGILYASDLYQIGQGGPPEYAWEVADAVRREKLDVRTVFAMHSDPASWQSLLDLVVAAAKVR